MGACSLYTCVSPRHLAGDQLRLSLPVLRTVAGRCQQIPEWGCAEFVCDFRLQESNTWNLIILNGPAIIWLASRRSWSSI